MASPRCSHCSEPMSARARADARYCSGRCRVAAHRASNRPPAELRQLPRWVRHTARKVPLTVEGKAASSVDPTTWATYAATVRSKVGAGAGFALNGDGIVCLDLDHCLNEGVLTDWAAGLLSRLPSTYIEVSPSGTGLHVWGHGTVVRGRRLENFEVYGTGRYITVTGRRWADAPSRLANLDHVITALL